MSVLLIGICSQHFNHIGRRGDLEHMLITEILMESRDRGRQQEKILDGLKSWHGKISAHALIRFVGDYEM